MNSRSYNMGKRPAMVQRNLDPNEVDNVDPTSEPNRKKIKLSKNSKETDGEATVGLTDLPTEVLEKIIGYANPRHEKFIRCTSKQLRDASDGFVLHEFRKSLNSYKTHNPNSYENAALQIIDQATMVYVQSGYSSTFCGCIQPLMKTLSDDIFSPDINRIKMFLLHFYDMMEKLIGDDSQKSGLLFGLTLMRLIRQFKKQSIIFSKKTRRSCRIKIRVRGPWLGMVWASEEPSRCPLEKRYHLLVVLSEVLIANMAGNNIKNVWQCENDIYVFGNNTHFGSRVPKTALSFYVPGQMAVASLFHSFFEDSNENLVWPNTWPKERFTIKVDIRSNEAKKWCCSKSQHLQFGPYTP